MRRLPAILMVFVALSGFDGGCDACDPARPGDECSQTDPCRNGLYCGKDNTCHTQAAPYLYVTDKIAKRMSFEIDYVQGMLPNQPSLDLMLERLQALNASGHVKKPEGFEYIVDDTIPAHADPAHGYTFEELHSIIENNKNTRSGGRYASAYLLYVDGHYAEDNGSSKVLGFAYGGDRIVIFKNTIQQLCSGGLFADEVCKVTEASVLLHEFGHLMGLVNNGLSMAAAHQDAAHTGHDSNSECLMYWAIETDSGVSLLLNRILAGNASVPNFDAACLADLAAAQNAD